MLKVGKIDWEKFSTRVHTWSFANFGKQRSKVDELLILNSLIPLLGMVEELSEFTSAKAKQDEIDAIADMCIYMADYYAREGMTCDVGVGVEKVNVSLLSTIGPLIRATVKRHQGIRGFDDINKYIEERDKAFIDILYTLDYVCRHLTKRPILDVAEEVFNKTVAKRNWVTNPQAG